MKLEFDNIYALPIVLLARVMVLAYELDTREMGGCLFNNFKCLS